MASRRVKLRHAITPRDSLGKRRHKMIATASACVILGHDDISPMVLFDGVRFARCRNDGAGESGVF